MSSQNMRRCVHCLKPLGEDEVTRDHVLPKSWYPDTTPSEIERWTVPSCRACNQEYAKIEQRLLLHLGICLDPRDTRSSGIVGKVLRALKTEYGKDDEDARKRSDRLRKILGAALYGNEIPDESIYPNFDDEHGLPREKRVGVLISREDLHGFIEKIVRGLYYVVDGQYIEAPYSIEVLDLRNEDGQVFRDLIAGHGKLFALGPGLTIGRARSAEDMSSLLIVEVWGKLVTYAAVLRRS